MMRPATPVHSALSPFILKKWEWDFSHTTTTTLKTKLKKKKKGVAEVLGSMKYLPVV